MVSDHDKQLFLQNPDHEHSYHDYLEGDVEP